MNEPSYVIQPLIDRFFDSKDVRERTELAAHIRSMDTSIASRINLAPTESSLSNDVHRRLSRSELSDRT